LELPDYAAMGMDSSQVKVMQTEAIKGLPKEIDKMRADRQRLYGLIRQHMSVESRDEVAQQPDYADWRAEKDPEKLWQAIVKTQKVDSASHVTEVMELTARKAYQGIGMGTFETLAMYSERFHETYRACKATASATNPVDVMDEVTYSRGEGFTVHMLERDIVLRRRDNLYVVDWAEVGTVHATVQENESLYSVEQVQRAKLAHEFVRNCGYPSPAEAVHIIRDGNV
jgi:hypothetical protein